MKYFFEIKEIDKTLAIEFVQERHYSKVMPKLTKHWLGCYLDNELVGVVTLGWGTQPLQTIKKLFPNLNSEDYYEIGKMCMDDSMPRNSESQMLSQVIRWMKINLPEKKFLYTWGDGKKGKLGHGNERDVFEPKKVEALNTTKVFSLSAGDNYSACVSLSFALFTWGCSEFGRLGHEENSDTYTPKAVDYFSVQLEVAGHTNEIPMAPRVLKVLDLQGKIVTGDALLAQRGLSQFIVEAGGDYVWTVKENQPLTYQVIELLFSTAHPLHGWDLQTAPTLNKGHGRIEARALTASSILPGELNWPYARQVFRLERTFTFFRKGQVIFVQKGPLQLGTDLLVVVDN